ncbi:MAG TPA: extracellular solute-binding protein [Thermoanaerobaculia bacterium]|jgi:molybdate/tungstate transport system substrate-binding protein|nr:extracellular solute-binding protein [Thermoanaerobaculia bacterium]
MKRILLSIRLGVPLLALLATSTLLFACADTPQKRSVSILYAGSLATVMENGVGPAFSAATGYEYKGEAHGSLGAARLIHDHLRSPDVFISADPSVNENVLMGSKNGDLVTWFVTLASSQLVLAYNPKSRFAANFEAAAVGKTPWYEVLETPGVRFGRGDPTIDPKGYRTLFLFTLAGKHYQRPEIPGLLGDTLNPAQVLPEVALLARIESGQFDAGIFYKHEIVAHKLPFVSFPPEINLGDSRFSALYAQATYTTPTGEHVSGAPILFTLTIPKAAHNQAGAEAFVRFLLTSPALLEKFGFGIVEHRVGGDGKQIPADLRSLCSGTYKP